MKNNHLFKTKIIHMSAVMTIAIHRYWNWYALMWIVFLLQTWLLWYSASSLNFLQSPFFLTVQSSSGSSIEVFQWTFFLVLSLLFFSHNVDISIQRNLVDPFGWPQRISKLNIVVCLFKMYYNCYSTYLRSQSLYTK